MAARKSKPKTRPAPAPQTEAERMMALLPRPPRPLAEQSEHSVCMWLRAVVEVGGWDGLQFAYRPENFPYGPAMRGRIQHIVGTMQREFDRAQQFKAEQIGREQMKSSENRAHEAKRARGWA